MIRRVLSRRYVLGVSCATHNLRMRILFRLTASEVQSMTDWLQGRNSKHRNVVKKNCSTHSIQEAQREGRSKDLHITFQVMAPVTTSLIKWSLTAHAAVSSSVDSSTDRYSVPMIHLPKSLPLKTSGGTFRSKS